MRILPIALVVALLSSACGSDSPVAPTQPSVNFTGVYNGTYIVASCTDPSGGIGFCSAGGFVPGARAGLSLSLGQVQTSVSGTLMLGSIGGPFQGTATGSGLNGTAALNNIVVSGATAIPNITTWNSTLTGNAMTGGFTLTFRFSNVSGTAIINANLSQFTR